MIVNKKLLFNIILTIALILILLSGAIIFGSKSIINQVFLDKSNEQLILIKNFKKQELENFFTNLQQQAKFISQDHLVNEAFQEFKLAFEQIAIVQPDEDNLNNLIKLNYPNPELVKYYNNLSKNYEEYFYDSNKVIDKLDFSSILSNLDLRSINLQSKYNIHGQDNPTISEYVVIHNKYHEYLSKIIADYNYNDLLLLDLNGNIIYSVKKNVDFAASVNSSNFLTTEIANLFNSIKYSTINNYYSAVSNFAEYFPDYYEPVCFVASKISNLGVLILSVKLSVIDNLMQLPKELDKIKIYLTDQDFRLINSDNFGKTINTSLLKANINNISDLSFKNKDKTTNISYSAEIKNNNLNLIVETHKNILLENLIKPLINMFYFSCSMIFVLLGVLYFIGWFNIEKTDKKLNKITEFMKTIIAKQDFSSRISMNSEDIPSNIADILNTMLVWFQKTLDQVAFKIKKFVGKYNDFLSSVTLVSSQLDKEQRFFSNAKDMINQLEVVVFKIQHECQQYYNMVSEQKNTCITFNDLPVPVNNQQNVVHLNGSLEYLLNICNFTEILCLQISLEGSKGGKFKNKKSLVLLRQLKPMLSNLKSKLLNLKNSLNGYTVEYNTMCNFVNDFYEKLKPISVNINRLLQAQKSLLLISNEQLDNVSKLQKELLNLELKYNNFNKQLLEIVNNNSKLNADMQINENETPIQVVTSKN